MDRHWLTTSENAQAEARLVYPPVLMTNHATISTTAGYMPAAMKHVAATLALVSLTVSNMMYPIAESVKPKRMNGPFRLIRSLK